MIEIFNDFKVFGRSRLRGRDSGYFLRSVSYFFLNCDQTFKTTPFEAVSTSNFKFNTRANVTFPCPRIFRKESVRPTGSDHNA